jgi:hypothetical protein
MVSGYRRVAETYPPKRVLKLEDHMARRPRTLLGLLAVVIACIWLAPASLGGQAAAPRTAWGHPDLQGLWASNSATPFERPKILEGRQVLTDQEVATLRARAAELFDGDTDAAFGDSVFETVLADAKDFSSRDVGTGNYNHFWLVDRWFDSRTSLITDPADGRLPPLTPEGEKRAAARAEQRRLRPADGPEDRSLSERCVTGGLPMTGRGYNSSFQFVQTPNYVVIHMEMMHDARIIPLDGRPHVRSGSGGYMGDSRGRWEGNTLVVETTNLKGGREIQTASPNVRLTERFTRVDAETLQYEFTVNDPETWTRPWTAMILMKPLQGLIYEFACHERNLGLEGILKGHRAQERDAQEAARKTSGASR